MNVKEAILWEKKVSSIFKRLEKEVKKGQRSVSLFQENSLNWFGDGITDSPTVALHASGDPLTVVCERPPSSRAGASPLTSPLCPADDQPHTYTGPPTHNIDTGLTSLAETQTLRRYNRVLPNQTENNINIHL